MPDRIATDEYGRPYLVKDPEPEAWWTVEDTINGLLWVCALIGMATIARWVWNWIF